MGPITLFDKSFLQSLSVNEAVIFDFLFMSNICPIFYVETLGDLAKEYKDGKIPEVVVRNLAEKTPEVSGNINAFHQGLLIGDLAGQRIEMEGRPVLTQGKPTRSSDGKSGVMFEPTDEEKAFRRWSSGRFLDVERDQASFWREVLASIDLEGFVRDVRIADMPKVETRQAALELVEATLAAQPGNMEVFFSILRSMGVPPHFAGTIVDVHPELTHFEG